MPPSGKEQGPQRKAREINTKQLFYLGWGVVSGWWCLWEGIIKIIFAFLK